MIFHCFPFLDEVNPALVNFLAGTYELSTISNVRLHLQGRVLHWLKNLTRHVVHGTLKYFFLSYSRLNQNVRELWVLDFDVDPRECKRDR